MPGFENQLEGLLASYREKLAAALETRKKVGGISGVATSRHQTVKVTVNVKGEITGLEFPTTAFRRMTPAELAEAIKATALEAKQDAAEKLRALSLPKTSTGVDYADMILGKVDIDTMLPAEVRIPPEVAEYLRSGRPGVRP